MSNSARPTGHSERDALRPAGPAPADPRRRPVVAALMLGMALAALDWTIIATAIPQIVGDLGGFAVFSWLFSGYLLAVTVTLPVYGKLSDTFGRKPILITGIVLFLAGSLACAGAWNMASLIAFRVIQGLGGGALQGTVQTIAADLYPMKERPKIQARLSSVWATSAVAGPALGGLLAAYADWRWIFLVNVPVGAVALWLIVRTSPSRYAAGRPPGPPPPRRLARRAGDLRLRRLLLTALVQGGVAWPWLSVPSLLLLGGSALCATAHRADRTPRRGTDHPRLGLAPPHHRRRQRRPRRPGPADGRPDRVPAHVRAVRTGPGADGRRLRALRHDPELAGLGRPEQPCLQPPRDPQLRGARHRRAPA